MVLEEIIHYSDLLNALTFEDIQSCPIAEKFNPRTLKVINMPFLGFWDKVLIHESMSFIPIFNLILITFLETKKAYFQEIYISLNLFSTHEGGIVVDWKNLSRLTLRSLLVLGIFKASLEFIKWQLMRLSNNYKLRNITGFPSQIAQKK